MSRLTIKEALKRGADELKSMKEAQILLSHFLNQDQLYLILNENETLKNPEQYFSLIKRAKNNEPIEYITNRVSFYSEEFFIQKGALIPRPETEILIDKVIEISKEFKNPKIAEIGVGSGIISIMLAKLIPNIEITTTDISEEAIQIAKKNALDFKVMDKIEFIQTSYLNNIDKKFDIIISNPPYIANNFKVEKNLNYEPSIALFGGERGDEILKNIIDIFIEKKASYLACEMGYDQKESLSRYLKEKGITNFSFYQDLAGFDRGFIGENHQR